MRQRLRRVVHRGFELSGLIGVLHRRQERRIAQQPHGTFEDGLPMPPAELRVIIGGTPDPVLFSERGKADAMRFMAMAEGHLPDRREPLDVWDLGCGCGRIARWIAPNIEAAGGAFHGSDINPRLVAWCAANLPGRYLVNRLRPPIKLATGSKDLVYAYSVLTHLREAATQAWLAEVARVLKPGGLALLTFHDEDYAGAWGPPGITETLEREPYLVVNNALEGSNYMSSWISRSHFSKLAAAHFEILEIQPGNTLTAVQATAVLRRRA
ncbi:MAG: class I SAM-dependent methyltransferase [Caulobacter sp.]|nr:class I SAM-dependent methyltransferase [Caulobacter sp.]